MEPFRNPGISLYMEYFIVEELNTHVPYFQPCSFKIHKTLESAEESIKHRLARNPNKTFRILTVIRGTPEVSDIYGEIPDYTKYTR